MGRVVSCRIQGALQTASGLEFRAGDTALSDDREEGADSELSMIRHRNRNRAFFGPTLHDHMAPAPTNLCKAMGFEYSADLSSREAPQLSHAWLRISSRRLRCAGAV